MILRVFWAFVFLLGLGLLLRGFGLLVSPYKREISVFDHVFGPGVIELRNYSRPMFSMPADVVHYHFVFLFGPELLHLGLVEMVEPTFAALLWSPEYFLLRFEEYLFGRFIPFALTEMSE